MAVAVLGAGAIGCVLAGYLKIKNEDVFLVARESAKRTIRSAGITINGIRGTAKVAVDVRTAMEEPCEVVFVCTKMQDLDDALQQNDSWLKNSIVVTTQNGIGTESIVGKYNKHAVISGIVMFGATSFEPGNVVHNFEGPVIIGTMENHNGDELLKVKQLLETLFPVIIAENINGMKYCKLMINVNNCIPALLGKSMQEVFADREIGKIAIALWREGLKILKRSNRPFESLPNLTKEQLEYIVRLPLDDAAAVYGDIMTGLSDTPVYGSILQSLIKRKATEIDYINGEFCRLSQKCGQPAPLNTVMVSLVHAVERSGTFFTRDQLLKETECYVNVIERGDNG